MFKSAELKISNGIIKFLAKSKFFTVQYIQFLTFFCGGEGWGGGGDETFPKFAESFAKSSPKFWQNFMSSKFQKNHNTNYIASGRNIAAGLQKLFL